MGGTFVSLGDDGSILFLNPAGLISAGSFVLYCDYSEPPDPELLSEAKLDAILPAGNTAFGAGYYRSGHESGSVEDLFIAGVARRILEGTRGSFLSAGVSFRLGRVSFEPSCVCRSGRASESRITGDIGVIVRPLPILSFGYSVENFREADFGADGSGSTWRTVNRWGFSYFWEERVILSYEQEHIPGHVIHHYGFSLRTAVPLELMAGFYEGNVSGGIRWINDSFRVAAAFTSDSELGVQTRVSLEVSLRKKGKGGSR